MSGVTQFVASGPPGVLLVGGVIWTGCMCLPDPRKTGVLRRWQLVAFFIVTGALLPLVLALLAERLHLVGGG